MDIKVNRKLTLTGIITIIVVIFVFAFSFEIIILGHNSDTLKIDTTNFEELDQNWYHNGEKINLNENLSLEPNESTVFEKKLSDKMNVYKNPTLRIYKYYYSIEIFLNGKKIGEEINSSDSIFNTNGCYDIIIPLDSDYVGQTLAVKLSNNLNRSLKINLPPIIIGSNCSVIYDTYINDSLTNYINIFLIILGALIILLSLVIKKNDEFVKLLNIGFLTLISGTYLLVSTRWFEAISDYKYLSYFLEYTTLMTFSWPLLIIIGQNHKNILKTLSNLLLSMGVALFLFAYILNFFFKIDFIFLVTYIQIEIIATIFLYGIAGLTYFKNRDKKSKSFLISFIPLLICILLDISKYYIAVFNGKSALFSQIGIIIFILVNLKIFFFNYRDYQNDNLTASIYKEIAYNDALTKIKNRTAYTHFCDNINKYYTQYNTVTAISIDLNRLKYTNDNFGHAKGDEILIRMANIIIQSTNDDDMKFRIGGDEFVIFLINKSPKYTEKIKSSIYKNTLLDNMDNSLELSYAIGSHTGENYNSEDIEYAVKKSDENMYKCKEKQHNHNII